MNQSAPPKRIRSQRQPPSVISTDDAAGVKLRPTDAGLLWPADELSGLFLRGVCLMDVRAPGEYARGAFPHTVNLPLMTDDERHQVGLCYRENGQDAALALGHRLVAGQLRADRVAAWAQFARQHPDGCLYCFRGGLRSRIVQQWLRDEAGIVYPRVEGGYKAMRNFLLGKLDDVSAGSEFIVLGGLTGTGKTELLAQFANGLDLEHHARHRGSSFGRHVYDQPAQISFENELAIALLRHWTAGRHRLIVEDEGRLIGRCAIPWPLYVRLQAAPMVWLEDSLSERVQRIVRDYIVLLLDEFMGRHEPDTAFALYCDRLRGSLAKIVRRLGVQRYQELSAMLEEALQIQERTAEVAPHATWITRLLTDYYDPMYRYQIQKRQPRIIFTGDRTAVADFLQDYTRKTANPEGRAVSCSA